MGGHDLSTDAATDEKRWVQEWESAKPPVPVVVDYLRAGAAPDAWFDRFLPTKLKRLSAEHWTPLDVTERVALWIAEQGIQSLVDIGSGVGKFCVATAVATRGCRFTGLEQRPALVEAARRLAERFGVEDRTQFVQGAFGECEVPKADAYYFFNPFGEFQNTPERRVDDAVEISEARFRRDVAEAERLLSAAPMGTYLIKYNGFGGTVPDTYDVLEVDREMPCVLRLWKKVR